MAAAAAFALGVRGAVARSGCLLRVTLPRAMPIACLQKKDMCTKLLRIAPLADFFAARNESVQSKVSVARWMCSNSDSDRTPSLGNLKDRVIKIVAEQLGVPESDVTMDKSFVNDLGADSLDTVELVMAFEDEFSIEVPDDDAEKMLSPGDLLRYIAGKEGIAFA